MRKVSEAAVDPGWAWQTPPSGQRESGPPHLHYNDCPRSWQTGEHSMIRTAGLTKRVPTSEGELTILNDVSLRIEAGESVAIVGASGSGKSTLLGLMAGLDTATSGEIWLDGRQLSTMDEEQRALLRAEAVGFVFQTFQLLPSLTALENAMLPIELKGEPGAGDKARKLLDRVGLGDRWHHYPNQLSGGEQQRVAIARAFATRARVLFADEPTGNLDTATGGKVIDVLFELNREFDTTLVLVTHEERLARKCGRSIRLVAGEIADGESRPEPAHA